jgi:hypothetical protein
VRAESANYVIGSGGIVFLATVLMLLFRQKNPRWWFDWNLALTRFGTRVSAYLALLRDEYPSTDDEQAVHVEIAYPDAARDLNPWLPLVKWFLAISALHPVVVPLRCSGCLRHHCLVRDPVQGSLSSRAVRLRRRGISLVAQGLRPMRSCSRPIAIPRSASPRD